MSPQNGHCLHSCKFNLVQLLDSFYGQNELYVAWVGITAVKVSDVVVWSSWGRDVMIAMDALLERGRFERDHYPGLHVLDERH